MTQTRAEEYIEHRNSEIEAGDLTNEVEVEFTDAHMKIRWADLERKGNHIFIFAEHYSPICQHVDETDRYVVRKMANGNAIKRCKDPKPVD